jgi:hypothetical protein
MFATTASVILPSARSSAKTSCSQRLRNGPIASYGLQLKEGVKEQFRRAERSNEFEAWSGRIQTHGWASCGTAGAGSERCSGAMLASLV